MEEIEINTENPFTGSYMLQVVRTYKVPTESAIKRMIAEGDEYRQDYYDSEYVRRVTLFENKPFTARILHEAKPNTIKLYYYITQSIGAEEDFISLVHTNVIPDLNITKTTLYMAIRELEKFRLLSRKHGAGQYWVNTELLFRGNRIEYIKRMASHCISIKHRRRESERK